MILLLLFLSSCASKWINQNPKRSDLNQTSKMTYEDLKQTLVGAEKAAMAQLIQSERALKTSSWAVAEDHVKKAFDMAPDFSMAYFQLGQIRLAQSEALEASNFCQEAQNKSASKYWKNRALECLAVSFEMEKNWEKAREAYRKLHKSEPDNTKHAQKLNELKHK